MAANTSPQRPPDTLAIDIGGTGIKASVLDATGQMEHARVRTDTPYPLSPQKLLIELQDLIAQLPSFDRISVGFPGMVRAGQILSAPHFVSPEGPGGPPAPKLVRAWHRFDLASSLQNLTGKPTKVANDADVQGAAVIQGHGLELVITLGTGVGTAFFSEGRLLPHLEFAHHPLRKGAAYNDVLGEAARKKAGTKKWKVRVYETVEVLRALCFFDHCYIGGGNSARLGPDLPEGVTVADNTAGILGGIKLWEVTSDPGREAATARRPAATGRRQPAANPGRPTTTRRQPANGRRRRAAPTPTKAPSARATPATKAPAAKAPAAKAPAARATAARATAARATAARTPAVRTRRPRPPAAS